MRARAWFYLVLALVALAVLASCEDGNVTAVPGSSTGVNRIAFPGDSTVCYTVWGYQSVGLSCAYNPAAFRRQFTEGQR